MEKKRPAEWAKEEGILILDPDGWRHDNKSLDDPIHYGEWTRRRDISTLAPLSSPKGPPKPEVDQVADDIMARRLEETGRY